MDPLIILLIGMAVVIGAVLWLRLHAFVALIVGALVVHQTSSRAVMEPPAKRVNRTKIECLLR